MKKKDVIIQIKGEQRVDGENDVVELFTTGSQSHYGRNDEFRARAVRRLVIE